MLYFIHVLTLILNAGRAYAATQYQWEVPMLPVPGTGQLPDVTVESMVSYIYSLGLALGGFFAFIKLVHAGIQWGGAGGNVGSVKAAQDTMKNVAFGLLLLLGAYALLNTINPEIVSPNISFPNSTEPVSSSNTNLSTAAALGAGTNSVGSSLTQLLQNVNIGNVLPDTWTQVQQKLVTVRPVERKTMSGDINQGGCPSSMPKPTTTPDKMPTYHGKRYAFPLGGGGVSCIHWGTAKRAMDTWPPVGSPNVAVYAVTDGYIEFSERTEYGGNDFAIRGDDGQFYYYAHNCAVYVRKGDRVSAGQVIALSGDTGANAQGRGAHLHFAINNSRSGSHFNGATGNGPGGGDVCPASFLGLVLGDPYRTCKQCCAEKCPY